MRIFGILLVVSCGLFALGLPVKYDPFVRAANIIEKSSKKPIAVLPSKRIKLHLEAIFNDKAVINGRFYAPGQSLYGYKLVYIGSNFVVLQKGKKKKMLTFTRKKILKMEKK